jgi:hypothetical protein
MIAWLSVHGAPRTAEVLRRLQGPYHGRVNDLMRWVPADRPAEAMLLAITSRACERPG